MLTIQHVTKAYSASGKNAEGDIVALDRVSIHIPKGEFAAVMGRSGSGKSTLLNMIAGLDDPDSGKILLDGTDITKLSRNKTAALRRRRIGMVYQFYNLIPELTVEENILLPTELDGREADPAWFREIISVMGLTGREGDYPHHLSGGQQQRVAVARALYQRPDLLLADEPTGNLDGENSREVMKLLSLMNTEYGVTLLVVTHSEEIAAYAGRLIRMEQGHVVEDRRR